MTAIDDGTTSTAPDTEVFERAQGHTSLGSWRTWHDPSRPIRLGVSSCLLGEEVRYNGGHARDRFVSDVLGSWIEWVPVCPEVESGMSVPRPTVRLVERGTRMHVVDPKSGRDWTKDMQRVTKERCSEFREVGLDGFVAKKNSPSCGMARVRVYVDDVCRGRDAVGFFTKTLMDSMPELPVEEDGRLNDPLLRENFIERIFAHNRWRRLVARRPRRRDLVAFHTAHKLLLWSHNEAGMRRLGRLLGSAKAGGDDQLFRDYSAGFHDVMRAKPTRKRHTNVLQHSVGYLKNLLPSKEKRELLQSIEDYRTGILPLLVPVTLLRFNAVRHDVDYLLGQLYFDPHPKELMLRNHV